MKKLKHSFVLFETTKRRELEYGIAFVITLILLRVDDVFYQSIICSTLDFEKTFNDERKKKNKKRRFQSYKLLSPRANDAPKYYRTDEEIINNRPKR